MFILETGGNMRLRRDGSCGAGGGVLVFLNYAALGRFLHANYRKAIAL